MIRQIYAEIVVDLAVRNLDRIFHYTIPDNLQDTAQFGVRVLVPFGNRTLTGYLVGFSDAIGIEHNKIKPIKSVIDDEPVFTPELWSLARWMKAYYLCTMAQALKCIVGPVTKIRGPRKLAGMWVDFDKNEADLVIQKLSTAPKKAAVLKAALDRPGLSKKELAAFAGVSVFTVNSLVKNGLLRSGSVFVRRNPYPIKSSGLPGPKLTPEQEICVREIIHALNLSQQEVFALHGITGSGKTEIYLRVIARTLALGHGAIVTVPEIALTSQMVNTFKQRFGEQVAVLHSGLSAGERYDEWKRISKGESKVVLGVRSAVFAPLPSIGLIIIDEEHDSSYKQEDQAKYHAREVALKRAKLTGAVVILGSATLSLESYCRALEGGPYHLLSLNSRVNRKPLPAIEIVDLRAELQNGIRGLFSNPLLKKIEQRINCREQVILFINRRGYAPIIVCRECGFVLKCPNCDISLTYHNDLQLRCHYCNFSRTVISNCPHCGSEQIRYSGTGTQKVEEEIKAIFPTVKVLRMDADTTTRKGSHGEILQTFLNGGADILVGTQMITKGLNLPLVTLVGVINADTTLHMPDFRAAERTFQLLTQVAGRAGRGNLPGEVVIQTYNPDHYSIFTAQRHDYTGFFNREISVRRSLKYPPFSRLIRILLSGEHEALVQNNAYFLKEYLAASINKTDDLSIDILGPAPAPLHKIKKKYRWQIILKGRSGLQLRQVTSNGLEMFEKQVFARSVKVSIDVEPQNMM